MDVNANLAECMVEKTGMTDTIVTNVCNGAVTLVPHTAVDFAFAGIVAAVLIGLAAMLVAMWRCSL